MRAFGKGAARIETIMGAEPRYGFFRESVAITAWLMARMKERVGPERNPLEFASNRVKNALPEDTRALSGASPRLSRANRAPSWPGCYIGGALRR